MAVLEKIEKILGEGGAVLGPKPERLVSLAGDLPAQQKFHSLAGKLWGDNPKDPGLKKIGNGRLIWGQSSRDFCKAKELHLTLKLSILKNSPTTNTFIIP